VSGSEKKQKSWEVSPFLEHGGKKNRGNFRNILREEKSPRKSRKREKRSKTGGSHAKRGKLGTKGGQVPAGEGRGGSDRKRGEKILI